MSTRSAAACFPWVVCTTQKFRFTLVDIVIHNILYQNSGCGGDGFFYFIRGRCYKVLKFGNAAFLLKPDCPKERSLLKPGYPKERFLLNHLLDIHPDYTINSRHPLSKIIRHLGMSVCQSLHIPHFFISHCLFIMQDALILKFPGEECSRVPNFKKSFITSITH